MVTEEIGTCLDTTQGTSPDIQGAYTILKRWYSHASARQPNSLWLNLEKVSWCNAALYQKEYLSPPGIPVLIHVDPFQIDSGVTMEAEVKASVRFMRVNRAGVHMHLQVKHFNMCLREAYPVKEATTPPPPPQTS